MRFLELAWKEKIPLGDVMLEIIEKVESGREVI